MRRGGKAALGLVAVTTLAGAACRGRLALAHTHESPQAVARAVVQGLAARDIAALRDLALSEPEFRELVWPKLPASRPERNVPWDYAWNDLRAKSDAHLRALLGRWQDHGFEIVSVSFLGETTEYGTFRVHRDTAVSLRDRDGQEQTGRLFGSMIEMNGGFKVFSYVVD
ncbi:MAG TPA: hypothetical protein VMR21_11195 [Vicinamibacteria bacterium]|nr:hypothetical protein [Vicinamibacteria bacterium]